MKKKTKRLFFIPGVILCICIVIMSAGCKPEDAETTYDSDGTSTGFGTDSVTEQAVIPEYWNGADIVSSGVEGITVTDSANGTAVTLDIPSGSLLSGISSLNAGPVFSSKGIYGSRYTVSVSLSDGEEISFTLTGGGIVITDDIFETQNGHEYRAAYKTEDTENYVSLLFELEKCFE